MNIIKLTKSNFDETVDKNRLLVIDFWAEWCAPCKSFAKVIETISDQYPQFVFGNVNIDEEKELAEEFAIQSIPAVMIIRDRVVIFAETGALSVKGLSDLLDKAK